jgi:hypothetical protein
VEAHVDVAAVVQVGVVAKVDDRGLAEPAAAGGETAAAIGQSGREQVGLGALGDEVGVDVEAADALVQIEELLRADLSGVERRQAVLDADVVERPPRKAGIRKAADLLTKILEDI